MADAGIAFEVVPGVSSAEAVPNYAGIPLTHRDYASSFTVVTGHEDPTRPRSRLDWARIAQIPGTLVILMGLKHLEQITDRLLAYGRSPETPTALIRWGTTSRQQVLEGTLASIAGLARQRKLAPPVVMVMGEVVKLRRKLNWFEKRPLLGQRVVVTQARGQARELTSRLRARGAEVLEVPALRFTVPTDPQPLRHALARLHEFEWIIFSSPHSVTAFFKVFGEVYGDWRDLGRARLGAYGPQTAAQLQGLHLRVEAMPTAHRGPAMVEALALTGEVRGRKILLLRPEHSSGEMPRCLQAAGALVEDPPCYQTIVETEDPTGAAASLIEQGADWITFTGLREVHYFQRRCDLHRLVKEFPRVKLATLGPQPSQLLEKQGFQPAAEATAPTVVALVEALEKAVHGAA